MPDVFAQLLKDLEDQNNRFNVDPDTLVQEEDMFAKLLRELEEQQAELQKQEKERQEKLAEIKKQDAENAYANEKPSFDDIKSTIAFHENPAGNKDTTFVNRNGTIDSSIYMINERWVIRVQQKEGKDLSTME